MSSALVLDPAELLDTLIGQPANQRLAFLRMAGNPHSLLDGLCEAVDRLAATDVSQGLAVSEMVVALADELSEPRGQADARGARAMMLAYAGRYQEALSACAAAVAIAEGAGCPVAAARARLASVHPLSELGRYEEAIAEAALARSAFVAAGEPVLAARADVSVGAVHDRRDDPSRALEHYDRALPALAGDPLVAAQVESNRGVALIGLDQFAGAEVAFETAVRIFSGSELHWAAAIAEGNLAFLATRQGRLERALHHFERARRLIETDESTTDLARLLAEQADALASLGMPAEALQAYEHVVPILEMQGLALEAAQSRAGLGRVQLQLGRITDAEDALASAAADLDRLGHALSRARVDLIRAELRSRTGRLNEARILAEDALEVFAGRSSDALVAHELLARIHLLAGNLGEAAAQTAAALPLAEQLDIAPLRARLLHARGLVNAGKGKSAEALRDFSTAVDQVERVRGVLQAERTRTAFLGSHLRIYEDAVRAALDGGSASTPEAFALVERAKSRALLDVVGGALDLADVAQGSEGDPAERALLAELARLRGELNWHYSHVDEGEDVPAPWLGREERQATMRRLEEELNALEDRLAASRGVAGLYAPPLSLDEALALAPTGTALIEYFVAGDEVVAFVLHEGGATVARHLATIDDLDERVSRVRFQIGRAIASSGRPPAIARMDRLLADARRELADLHDLLIAPVAHLLAGARRLLIVPHGSLHALPFAALWDGSQYLIEKHEIVSVPSASIFGRLAVEQAPTIAAKQALVVGVPDELTPWIATETAAVAALLDVRAVVGNEATVARFAEETRGADIIHLACHGRFSPDRPLSSGLKLADRWLTVRDVYSLRLNASLVTLSGCETGRSGVTGGDELLGLLRGFFAAGASSLVISLWVVNDQSTTALMTDFYAAYAQGESPAAALRSAQRASLARGSHPAFWAPFILGGHP